MLGSGSDTWKYWDRKRAGTITDEDWRAIEGGIARSPGHCMTMGTASTMTAAAEALGLTLPGASSVPEPRTSPRQCPGSMGPAGTKTAGRSTLAAPISSAGVDLSQPPIRTAPSTG